MDIRELNKQLSSGVLPDVLNYTIEQKPLDICELKYNAFYRSYGFVESKFPKGYDSIPAFDCIIQSIADKFEQEEITPLKEMLEKSANRIDEQPVEQSVGAEAQPEN
jgi:hypothetical protein